MNQRKDEPESEIGDRTEVVSYEQAIKRSPSTPKQLGRYRLDGVIAQGGMAEIWLATVEGPGRFQKKVVVKRIRPSLVKTAQDSAGKHVEMFIREARLLSRLEHKHIVQVLELGVEPPRRAGDAGEHYIVMERLEGLTLRDIALRTWRAGQPLPVEVVVRLVADACLGLEHAHNLKDERGQPAHLVHRDISPDNLFVTREGLTKLIDFGIARREDWQGLTSTGELKGKVPYMAPEQLRGDRLDARTDLFAVGVVLYWLLSGRRPFDGPTDIYTMKAILDDEPRPLRALNPSLPPLLSDVVMSCLEKDPGRRIGSAAALHDTLSMLLLGLTGTPPDAGALVTTAEALPPITYESTPDVAAVCVQGWPGALEDARAAWSAAPSVRDAVDASQASTMQMALAGARLGDIAVAPVGIRMPPSTQAVVDEDDAMTLPPGEALESTADGPVVGGSGGSLEAPTAAYVQPWAPRDPARLVEPAPRADARVTTLPEVLRDTVDLTLADLAQHAGDGRGPTSSRQMPSSVPSASSPAPSTSPTAAALAAAAAADSQRAPRARAGRRAGQRRVLVVALVGVVVVVAGVVGVVVLAQRLPVGGGLLDAAPPAAVVDAGTSASLPVVDAGAIPSPSAGAPAQPSPPAVDAGVAPDTDAGAGSASAASLPDGDVDAGVVVVVDAGGAVLAVAGDASGSLGDGERRAPLRRPLFPPRRAAARPLAKASPPSSAGASSAGASSAGASSPAAPPSSTTGHLVVRARPWARVTVDGVALGTTPLPPLPLTAGAHRVRLTFDSTQRDEVVVVRAGQTALVQVDMNAR